jgi:hypothetical protein
MSDRELIQEASDRVKAVRADPAAEWPEGSLEAADAALDAALGGMPTDPANPPPQAPQFVAPLAPGAIYGQTKWLAGSLGCDLFVVRGTPVFAPVDCVIEEVLGGQGLSGGDELILATSDRQLSFRYRHTVAECRVGDYFEAGERLGHVGDDSLDLLGPTPAWFPAPDGYQHLDLSVAYGTDQFSPQGGGGGNVSAYDWLRAIGYVGTVYTRTPGPPDAGR